jgi:DNA repair protein RadC
MDAASCQKWRHPGGKLKEFGPENLSDAELLAIMISAGIKVKPEEHITAEILARFGSFKAMADHPIKKFLEIRGLGGSKDPLHRRSPRDRQEDWGEGGLTPFTR